MKKQTQFIMGIVVFLLYTVNILGQVDLPAWEMRGPTKFMGRVSAVVADSQNPDKVYVGAASGGVWKSTDGGAHYTPIFDHAGSLSIGALALDPHNSNTIYVGTGEVITTRAHGFPVLMGDGIWKSTDAGQHWRHLDLNGTKQISSIVINPNNTNEIFAAVFKGSHQSLGIFKSSDGGETWSNILHGAAYDIQMDPNNPERLYAVLKSNGEVYKGTSKNPR